MRSPHAVKIVSSLVFWSSVSCRSVARLRFAEENAGAGSENAANGRAPRPPGGRLRGGARKRSRITPPPTPPRNSATAKTTNQARSCLSFIALSPDRRVRRRRENGQHQRVGVHIWLPHDRCTAHAVPFP